MEQIKDIPGYEGLYEITTKGVIYRKREIYINNLGNKCIRKRREIASRNNHGRRVVTLCKNGKPKDHFVHRLVAETYIPKPNNYLMVNHKDENPMNNSLDNLEWCDNSYNQNYGTCPQRKAKSEPNREPVVKIISDKHIIIYERSRYAEKIVNVDHSAIRRACADTTGNRYCKGFLWRFPTLIERVRFNSSKKRELEIIYD